MNLEVNYLGLKLKNPVIIGASNLVTDINILKKLEEAGASAIVYKSLFEEQINLENFMLGEEVSQYDNLDAESSSFFHKDLYKAGPEEFIMNFKEAKKVLNIPLIASLNAVFDDTWYEYSKKLEEAGADAIELNFYNNPRDFGMQGRSILNEEIDTLKGVKDSVKIPVSVKLSPFYTNILFTVKELEKAGSNGFVLFNKLFQPDIDINKEELRFPYNLSGQGENKLPMRYVGLLFGETKADICANTGIYTGEDVIKMILAGADTVQVVSTIYKNGPQYISKILEDIELWMANKGYKSLDDFRGKLSRKKLKDPFAYRRAQYVDILLNSSEIFKEYPLI
jgi:dihydroorotate dehydrogenase (fumarate)